MKGTKNLSKKRARPARSAKENQRHIIILTMSSAEGFYVCKMELCSEGVLERYDLNFEI